MVQLHCRQPHRYKFYRIFKVYLLRHGVIDSTDSSLLVLAYRDQVQKEIGYVSFSDISSCDWSFAILLGNKTLTSEEHTHMHVQVCVLSKSTNWVFPQKHCYMKIFLDGVAFCTSSINYRSFGFPLVIENVYVWGTFSSKEQYLFIRVRYSYQGI